MFRVGDECKLVFVTMKKVFFVTFAFCLFSVCLTVTNVCLVDYRSYLISLIQKTVNRVEEQGWSNLKVDDIAVEMNETIFGVQYTGHLDFKNGFVVSIQRMNIIEHTIQQMWVGNADGTTSAQPQATLQLNNAAIGFDVTARVNDQDHFFTGVILYPTIQLQFLFEPKGKRICAYAYSHENEMCAIDERVLNSNSSSELQFRNCSKFKELSGKCFPYNITDKSPIPKNVYTDVITARVVATVVTHNNRLQMMPYNHISRTIPYFFQWNSIVESATRWADQVFAPVAQDLALHVIPFPTICYNCAVV